MLNISKLLVDKEVPITRYNCHRLKWFIHIKIEPLEDDFSRDMYFRIYKYVAKGDSTYTEYQFRQYNQIEGTWGQLSVFIKTTDNIWNQNNNTINDVYIKASNGVTVSASIKGRLYFMLISHSELDDDGNIFQLYFSGSELEIDLQNYKKVSIC